MMKNQVFFAKVDFDEQICCWITPTKSLKRDFFENDTNIHVLYQKIKKSYARIRRKMSFQRSIVCN